MKIHGAWLILFATTGCYGRAVLVEGSGAGGSQPIGGAGNSSASFGGNHPSTSTGGNGHTTSSGGYDSNGSSGGTNGSVSGGTAASTPLGGSGGTVTSSVHPAGATSGGANAAGAAATGIAGAAGNAPVDPNECPAVTLPIDATRPGYSASRDPGVASLLSTMSPEAKIKQLYGLPNPTNRGGDVWRDFDRCQDVDLGNGKIVRGYKLRDGARGLSLVNGQHDRQSQGMDYSTAFPATSTRAASWDTSLEMRVGEAIGDEMMATRNNLLLAPSVTIVRHPYWGRTQEAYGEDVFHVGRMASAFTAGVQQHVLACAIHYTANNIETNRSNRNASMDEQTLREVYGRPFDMVVREGGVGCVMAAYNSVNGIKATQNKHLLTDILKGPVSKGGSGFRGMVVSDLWAMPGDQTTPDTVTAQSVAAEAIGAGLDVELPWALHYDQLAALVGNGNVTQAQIDNAVGRVLEQKFRFGNVYSDSPWGLGTAQTKLYGDSIVNDDAHLALAEETEIKSSVLLANGFGSAKVLPIKNATSIAVVGLEVEVRVSAMTEPPVTGNRLKLGSDVNIGDRGSSRINADPAKSIGPFAGIKAAAARHGITNVTTGSDVAAAQGADVVVVVVGLTAGDEGEEYSLESLGDRRTLSLGTAQETFVNDVLALNKPTAIIVESGSIVNLPWLTHSNKNQATIWAGYGGMRAGAAFGKLLLGDANFSGKMPMAWAKEADLLPFQPIDLNNQMDYFFGYRDYDTRAAKRASVDLVFPFGWGLSYTQFTYSNLTTLTQPCRTTVKDNVVNYVVDVKNTGALDGEEVVMLFVKGPPKPESVRGYRPVKELKSFAKANILAGQTAKVTLPLNISDLRHWEGDSNGSWVIDEGEYTILVGPNGADASLQLATKLTVRK